MLKSAIVNDLGNKNDDSDNLRVFDDIDNFTEHDSFHPKPVDADNIQTKGDEICR